MRIIWTHSQHPAWECLGVFAALAKHSWQISIVFTIVIPLFHHNLSALLSVAALLCPLFLHLSPLNLIVSLLSTVIFSSTGYFILVIVAVSCLPYFRLTHYVFAQTTQVIDIANKNIAVWSKVLGTPYSPIHKHTPRLSGYAYSLVGVHLSLYLGIYFLPVCSDLFGQL